MQITEDMLRQANEADRRQMDAHASAAAMLAGAIKAREALIAEMQRPEDDPAEVEQA
jgi:hypothetical protein